MAGDGPTRAELLEQCKAAGLKATGWKKEKMAAELAKLQVPVAPPLEQVTSEEEGDEKPTEASSPTSAPGRCGWCQPAPVWSRSHLQCRESDRPCGCECNDPDWVRPEIPEGAQLSRFNREDREPRGLPWDPRPGSQLADKAKLAEGLKEVNDDDRTGSAGAAPGGRPAELADLVPAGAGQAEAPDPAPARAEAG